MKLFTYGSLKKGFFNDHLLNDSEYICSINTLYYNYKMYGNQYFPFVIIDNNGGKINGEIYEIDNDTLSILDYIESNGSFYQRQIIQFENNISAWMYFLIDFNIKYIKNNKHILFKNHIYEWI